ncbi:MAG: sporulation protein [Firmicutes bacterium]|nr:sporulation protein [Bacillota bacterium]
MAENKHMLLLEDRSVLHISGVSEVAGFDDERIDFVGSFGGLTILGQGLKISALDLDTGKVSVSGRTDALCYGEAGKTGKCASKAKRRCRGC